MAKKKQQPKEKPSASNPFLDMLLFNGVEHTADIGDIESSVVIPVKGVTVAYDDDNTPSKFETLVVELRISFVSQNVSKKTFYVNVGSFVTYPKDEELLDDYFDEEDSTGLYDSFNERFPLFKKQFKNVKLTQENCESLYKMVLSAYEVHKGFYSQINQLVTNRVNEVGHKPSSVKGCQLRQEGL